MFMFRDTLTNKKLQLFIVQRVTSLNRLQKVEGYMPPVPPIPISMHDCEAFVVNLIRHILPKSPDFYGS